MIAVGHRSMSERVGIRMSQTQIDVRASWNQTIAFGMTIIVMKNEKQKRSPRASFQVHHTSRPPCQKLANITHVNETPRDLGLRQSSSH